MDNYETPLMRDREKVKIELYEKFERKYAKKYRNLNQQEFEHERNLYINQNFIIKLTKHMKSKK